jgi:magnesium-transporting ATPase (P-type)
MKEIPGAFWSFSGQELLTPIKMAFQGLTRDEARRRLEQDRSNRLKASSRSTSLSLFLNQFKSPSS